MKRRLLIIGAGGHGRSVAEIIQNDTAYELIGFLDDSWPMNQAVWRYPILGNTKELDQHRMHADWAIVAIGNNKLRKELTVKLIEYDYLLAVVTHPKAIISPSAVIGAGTVVMAGGIVGTESVLGEGVIVNSGANVDHHCVVENFGHLGVNSCMAGGSRLGEGAWLHAGSSVGYGGLIPGWEVIPPGVGVSSN